MLDESSSSKPACKVRRIRSVIVANEFFQDVKSESSREAHTTSVENNSRKTCCAYFTRSTTRTKMDNWVEHKWLLVR